ncbi:hypothetical protein LXA43DRAFT_520257 [Ganoderma leucocontextum]|nr:hypothetical protein LXA43DRAFT_520257 [Ganoderma leucocontextum]
MSLETGSEGAHLHDSDQCSWHFRTFRMYFLILDASSVTYFRSLPYAANDETRTVRAELYQLDVHGEGACHFKPHKDTPRSQSMFRSLVIVFPTPAHEDGALDLGHEDENCSDVEHEVMPVVTGHRVTLTDNLYYGARRKSTPSPSIEVLQPLHASVPVVKLALASLLDAATVMPDGGMLGFGLYPLPNVWVTRGLESPLKSLKGPLKGSDAAPFQACNELWVQPLLRLVSADLEDDTGIVLDRMLELGDCIEHAESELRRRGGVLLNSFTVTRDAEDSESRLESVEEGELAGRVNVSDSRT